MFNNASHFWRWARTKGIMQLNTNLGSHHKLITRDYRFASQLAQKLDRWEGGLHSRILSARGLDSHEGSTSDLSKISRCVLMRLLSYPLGRPLVANGNRKSSSLCPHWGRTPIARPKLWTPTWKIVNFALKLFTLRIQPGGYLTCRHTEIS